MRVLSPLALLLLGGVQLACPGSAPPGAGRDALRPDLPIWITDQGGPGGEGSPSCSAPSDSCWDVQAVFSQTDFEDPSLPPKVFGQSATDGQTVYALLDGTQDDTYREQSATTQCAGNRPKTWHIERKVVAGIHKIHLRGGSDADCGHGQPVCAGQIRVNMSRGWRITQTVSCSVSQDTLESNQVQIDTACTVDMSTGLVSWKSGSTCKGCCACPDGARVTIEINVAK